MVRLRRFFMWSYWLIWGWFALDVPFLYSATTFLVFQSRDMHRALELMRGQSIWFGPEMTGGGNLPGPLYYFMLLPGLMLEPSWRGAWLINLLAVSAGAAVGWWFFAKRMGTLFGLLWLGLYLTSLHTFSITRMFLNVSYVWPFAVLSLLGIALAYTEEQERVRRTSLIVAGFSLGLSLQLHFSLVVVLIALLLLQIFAPYWRLKRLPARTFALGFMAFLVTLVPYGAWLWFRSQGYEGGQMPTPSGTAVSAPRSLILLVSDVLNIGYQNILKNSFLWTLASLPPALILVGITELAAKLVTRETIPTEVQPNGLSLRLQRVFLVLMVAGFFPFAYWFFAAIGRRYVIPFHLAILCLTVIYLSWIWNSRLKIKIFNWLSLVGLLGLVGFALVATPTFEAAKQLTLHAVLIFGFIGGWWLFFVPVQERKVPLAVAVFLALALNIMHRDIYLMRVKGSIPILNPTYSAWEMALGRVYELTGWSKAKALSRIYFVNHHLEHEPGLVYDTITRGLTPWNNNIETNIDGFIYSVAYPEISNSSSDILDWLLTQNIQVELKAALRSGEIRIASSVLPHSLLVPYRVQDPKTVPQHFHNYSTAYLPAPLDQMLLKVPEPEGVRQVGADHWVFKWNECPEPHAFCNSGALVSLTKNKTAHEVQIVVLGQVLGQISPWIFPAWTQSWIRPFLKIECGNEEHFFKLAESVGYRRKYAADPSYRWLYGNNSFVTPFTRSFAFACAGAISKITVGREGSEVESLYQLQSLPAKQMTHRL